ncbi:MAG TPA: hypothetical protein EYN28_07305 [Flavobacteriales bacterium]|nr:hypothetical protein [Flavobacteriales bacterium]
MIVLPSCPFPSIAWYYLAYANEAKDGKKEVVIDVHENFVKQTLRNRIALTDAHGNKFITLPVHRRNAHSRFIADIVFTDSMNHKVVMRNIRTAYGAAPFYDHFAESLGVFLEKYGNPGKSLLEFNLESLKWVEFELGLNLSNLATSDTYIKASSKADDFRIKGAFSNDKWNYERYPQVFEDRNGFIGGLSILDALFHGGPEAEIWWNKKVVRLSSRND